MFPQTIILHFSWQFCRQVDLVVYGTMLIRSSVKRTIHRAEMWALHMAFCPSEGLADIHTDSHRFVLVSRSGEFNGMGQT